jgi:hypothetical protein
MPFVLAATIAIVLGCPPVAAGVSGTTVSSLKSAVAASDQIEPVCRGCGCRGGPGYRLPNGKCGSWGRR